MAEPAPAVTASELKVSPVTVAVVVL